MEFRLLYDGQVPSSGNTGKAKTVHSIRRIFHPQLRRLWHTEKNLWEMAMRSFEYTEPRSVTEEERFKDGLAAIGNNWSRAGPICSARHPEVGPALQFRYFAA